MRKIVLPLVVALFATPVWATNVTISCEDTGGGVVAVNYEVTGNPAARAFALDITVSAGVIESISDFKIGESTAAAPGFGIFPASFAQYVTVDPDTGEADWSSADYSPLADPCDPGALGGVGTGGITVEAGALYYPTDDSSPNAPPASGTLCKITVSENCTVTLAENVTRGGVVLTDPSVTPNVTLGTCDVIIGVGCALESESHPDHEAWVALGKPDCWCTAYQCDGDVDGATETLFKYRIYGNDLSAVVNNWKKKGGEPDFDPCADIDHKTETLFKYRVYGNDLSTVVNNWKAKDAALPGDCPR
jgi:hypothetical protein